MSLVYGSRKYHAHVADQRAIFEGACQAIRDAGLSEFMGLPVVLDPEMERDELRLESPAGSVTLINLGTDE